MKPFNLEQALAGRKFTSETGLPCALQTVTLFGNPFHFVQIGTNGPFPLEQMIGDLYMVVTKHTGYVNLYRGDDGKTTGGKKIHVSIAAAKEVAGDMAVGVGTLTWEE